MVLEDMIVRGLRATEKMTWLDAYGATYPEHPYAYPHGTAQRQSDRVTFE